MSGLIDHQETHSTRHARRLKDLRILLGHVTLTVSAAYVLFTFIFGVHRMTGNSMFPNIKDGDLCITLLISDPGADDIVLYEDPDGVKRMGRVAATAGDAIGFINERISINGITKEEEIMYPTYGNAEPTHVGEGELYVLNDYRLDEDDSRLFGTVRMEDTYGKLIFILRRRGF